jgi:hypothetical protein
VVLSPAAPFDLSSLLLLADEALYRAKTGGRTRLTIAAPQPPAPDDDGVTPEPSTNVVRIGRRTAA